MPTANVITAVENPYTVLECILSTNTAGHMCEIELGTGLTTYRASRSAHFASFYQGI